MMKAIVITLIVAICVQCVLSVENAEESRRNRLRRRRTARLASRRFTEPTDVWDRPPPSGSRQFNNWNNEDNYLIPPIRPSSPSRANAMRFNPAKGSETVSSSTFKQTSENIETVIKGEKGTIEVNGKVVVENDEKLKNHLVSVSVTQGRISINGKMVFEGKPSRPNNFSTSTVNSTGINSFKMEIFKDGQYVFTDDKGSITNGNL